MAQYNEEITISYGGFSVGGSTARQLDGENPIRINEGYEDGYVEFDFVTTATTEALFAAEVAAVEAAFRDPRNDLTITQGSETILSRKHSTNTALDTNPTITKAGDVADTGRSRHYTVRIEYGLPADNVGTNSRRWSNVNISYDASRIRTVTITGTYTATSGGSDALATYLAQINTYFTTVTAGIDASATWEIIEEPTVERNDTDKIVQFTIVGRELIFNQAEGVLDDSAIVNPSLSIERMREEPGDSEGGGFSFGESPEAARIVSASNTDNSKRRPITLSVTYSCQIDATATKALESKWKSTIRPFLINQARRSLSGYPSVAVCLIEEKPVFDYYGNAISATMVLMSYNQDIQFEKVIKVTDNTSFNKQLTPLTTGNPLDYYEFPGPVVRTRTCEIEFKKILEGTVDGDVDQLVAGIDSEINGSLSTENWVKVTNSPQVEDRYIGLDGANKKRMKVVRAVYVAQRRNKITPSVATGGGITGVTFTV